MTAEQFRTWIAPVSQAVGVLVAVGGLVWWGALLNSRVATLESQMYAVLTAPNKTISISQQKISTTPAATSPQGTSSSNFGSGSADPGGAGFTEQTYLTPLVTACANLAWDVNMAQLQHTKKGDQAATAIKNFMSDLPCSTKTNY